MSRCRAYAELLRLPNVFTALADIVLGVLAVWAVGDVVVPALALILLLAASACLYSAGMVWNDFFDVEQDRRERPFRPLPSGRITRAAAAWVGRALLGVGVTFGVLAGLSGVGFRATPGLLTGLLAAAILLYDGVLKRGWAGPLGMGFCRFLNVCLGLSAAPSWLWGLPLALVVGLYVVGVTWFARTEARVSSSRVLTAAAGVMLGSLVLALPLPVWLPARAPGAGTSPLFPYLLVGFGFLVGIPVYAAVARPLPGIVQAAVRRAVLGLVLLDAILATAVVGAGGLAIAVLILPALYLGRWIYST